MNRELVLTLEHLESIIRLAYMQGWVDAEHQPDSRTVDLRPNADAYAEEFARTLFSTDDPAPGRAHLEVVR